MKKCEYKSTNSSVSNTIPLHSIYSTRCCMTSAYNYMVFYINRLDIKDIKKQTIGFDLHCLKRYGGF